jgi:hypothetical protein
MSGLVVYDKVSWHFPEGKDCPSLSAAKKHFEVLMNWLKQNHLLSNEGEEIFELGIDADFSINSSMLSQEGQKIMDEIYSSWLGGINYDDNVDLTIFNAKIDI